MTSGQRVLSLLFVAHLLALLIGAIPPSDAGGGPIRSAVGSYLRATAQTQGWIMFVTPSHASHLVRLGYRLRLADGSSRVEYERIYPDIEPGRWKLAAAYFESFTNKTFTAVTNNYLDRWKRAERDGVTVPTNEMIRGLQPVTRYYARRRVAAGIPPGAALEAVEFWRGTVEFSAFESPRRLDEEDAEGSIEWQLWWTDDLR